MLSVKMFICFEGYVRVYITRYTGELNQIVHLHTAMPLYTILYVSSAVCIVCPSNEATLYHMLTNKDCAIVISYVIQIVYACTDVL